MRSRFVKNQKRPKKGHSNHYLDKNNRGLFKKQIKMLKKMRPKFKNLLFQKEYSQLKLGYPRPPLLLKKKHRNIFFKSFR